MAQIKIAAMGATGALGRRVARRLAGRGISQRLIVRNAARAPVLAGAEPVEASYQDRPTMVAGLRGIETVFFVSGFESENRLAQHKAAIDAFVEAGVQRVIYTSCLNAAPDSIFTFSRHHCHTEAYLEAAGLRFAALRTFLHQQTQTNP